MSQLYCRPDDRVWAAPLENPFAGRLTLFTPEFVRARDGSTRREMNAGIPFGAAYALGQDRLLHLTPFRDIPPCAPFIAG